MSVVDLLATVGALRDALSGSGGTLDSPATEAKIAATKAKLGIPLPLALQQVYRAFDGSLTATKENMWNF